MADTGFFSDIARVLGGKGQLRLIVQPALAIVFGVRLGIADAHEGREPFGLRVFRARHKVLRLALSDIIVPFLLAMAIDSALQYYTLGYVRPFAAVLVALLIVWLPFSIARGLANRIARMGHGAKAPHAP